MRAGQLRHLLTIQQRQAGSPNKRPSGAPDESWTTFGTSYGAIEPLKGREFIEAQAVQARVDVRIRMRYLAGVTAAMRVSHNGVIYSIEAVINPELRNRELHLMCSQGVNNG